MPTEVVARLVREGGVYLAGEPVFCRITLTNKQKELKSAERDSIAWCSVQLHCTEILNNHRVKVSSAKNSRLKGGAAYTAFAPDRGENGRTIFASKPTVLFCELELLPGESKSFVHSELVPEEDTPPSYAGQAVRYYYKLTVGVQHVNSPVKLLQLPIRVLRILTTAGLTGPQRLEEEQLSPSNPFLHDEISRPTSLQIANQIIENVTGVRNCQCEHSDTYNIMNEKGRVGEFVLYKNSYKLGDDVMGKFCFENADVLCYQYTVSLQAVEEVAEEWRVRPEQAMHAVTHSTVTAVALFLHSSEVKLEIPLVATPTFFTEIVHLKWRLYFEFLLCRSSAAGLGLQVDEMAAQQGHQWTAPSKVDVETMVWEVPIKVFPCNPLSACLGTAEPDRIARITL